MQNGLWGKWVLVWKCSENLEQPSFQLRTSSLEEDSLFLTILTDMKLQQNALVTEIRLCWLTLAALFFQFGLDNLEYHDTWYFCHLFHHVSPHFSGDYPFCFLTLLLKCLMKIEQLSAAFLLYFLMPRWLVWVFLLVKIMVWAPHLTLSRMVALPCWKVASSSSRTWPIKHNIRLASSIFAVQQLALRILDDWPLALPPVTCLFHII